MSAVMKTIEQQLSSLSEGRVLSPKEFLHLGSRASVDQTFSRLVKAGKLLRISRGAYVAPVISKFGKRAPTPERVVASIAEKNGETIVHNGAAAANALGLTTQVPVREVYLTSGPSRHVRLGAREIEVQHAPQWQLVLGGSPAGRAVRALAWLGEKNAQPAVSKLGRQLSREEWKKLLEVRSSLPSWMAKAISEVKQNE